VREPLCSCLSKLSAALSALPVDGQLVHNTTELKPAIDSLKVSVRLPLLWLPHCMLCSVTKTFIDEKNLY
jgi:hypothetical protein